MCEREMYYKRITSTNDADIPYLTFILKSPEISRYISIAENSYWEYVTTQEQVYYFKVYRNDALIGAIHCEIENLILYMDIMVFPKYQRQGIATAIMEDILQGNLSLEFDTMEVFVDESNAASKKLFEKIGFTPISCEDELIHYTYTLR